MIITNTLQHIEMRYLMPHPHREGEVLEWAFPVVGWEIDDAFTRVAKRPIVAPTHYDEFPPYEDTIGEDYYFMYDRVTGKYLMEDEWVDRERVVACLQS